MIEVNTVIAINIVTLLFQFAGFYYTTKERQRQNDQEIQAIKKELEYMKEVREALSEIRTNINFLKLLKFKEQ